MSIVSREETHDPNCPYRERVEETRRHLLEASREILSNAMTRLGGVLEAAREVADLKFLPGFVERYPHVYGTIAALERALRAYDEAAAKVGK